MTIKRAGWLCKNIVSLPSIACLMMFISACHSITSMTLEAGISQKVEITAHFKHRVFIKPGAGELLHIYIEGDGLAWQSRNSASTDPSPNDPTMFRLMTLDSAPAVYIGRPCYFMKGFEEDFEDPECSAYWWTFGRYSEKVVNSMANIIERESESYNHIVLIGHSGGGTLATLLAARNQKTVALVTAAANLNVAEWVSYHKYTPLYGSLDPTQEVVLPNSIVQLHYIGDSDNEIEVSWQKEYLSRQPNASLTILPEVTHQGGWDAHWLSILNQLSKQIPNYLFNQTPNSLINLKGAY